MIKIKNTLKAEDHNIYLFQNIDQLRPVKDALFAHWRYITDKINSANNNPTCLHFNLEKISLILTTSDESTQISDYKMCMQIDAIRQLGASMEKYITENKAASIAVHNLSENKSCIYPFLEGLLLSHYRFDKYLSHNAKKSLNLKDIFVLKSDVATPRIKQLSAIVESVHWARDLVNEPPNVLTATELASRIKAMAKSAQLRCQILDKKKIQQLKMGGLLAVNQGSLQEPTFTIIEHKPENAINQQPYVLIGKGVVYDTGGLSLKPTPNSMDKMKSDMAGAAVVAAVMQSIAILDLPIHVVALIPATDNRPGYEAYTPGDIITMHSGHTVEVLNTDAEGRMILADAIHYAHRYSPKFIQTVATLTGAASAAIGPNALVAMGNVDPDVLRQYESCGYHTNEKVAIMPFWDEYAEYLKTPIADMKNIGGSVAGAITAGKFLEKFTPHPFMHFDIAGVSFADSAKHYAPTGGTGFGVRLICQYFINLCKK